MTLRDQINLELDDVYPDKIFELFIKPKFPQLTLDGEVPEELSEAVSLELSQYAK